MDVEHVDKKQKLEEEPAKEQITIDLGEALKKRQESDLDMLRIIAILVQRVEKLESVFKSFQ
jgi:hypothetical protein